MAVENVGVVGAGVMGCDVAFVLAQRGFEVTLVDNSPDARAQAASRWQHAARMQRLLGAGGEWPADPSARILVTADLASLAGAGAVIENVPEDWEIKKDVYSAFDGICEADCILAANTSTIPVARFASMVRRPERVIGVHFMNPVTVKPVVEVIRGRQTSDSTLARTLELLAALEKRAIVVADAPGFVSNRVEMLTVNEAICVLADGLASASDIDAIFRQCMGHQMGPLETADLIGLDTVRLSLERLYEAYGDPKFRPCPLLVEMVDHGLLGRKSGRGFHPYANEPGSAERQACDV